MLMLQTKHTQSIFISACLRKNTASRPPVWLMRQAGRYQQSYRRLKEKYSMKELCTNPDLMVEITLLPVKEFLPDAAIIFSDLLIPLASMGIDFDYESGTGPVIHNPLRDIREVEQLKPFEVAESLHYTGTAIRELVRILEVPLIGFVGAPFTLASYMLEGKGSKNYVKTKQFMYHQPQGWQRLMQYLSDKMAEYAIFQAYSGASAIQFFDSWVGVLDKYEYDHFVLPYLQAMMDKVKLQTSVPLIYFGTSTSHLLSSVASLNIEVIGVDWRVPIKEAYHHYGERFALQGNLDPTVLFSDKKYITKRVTELLEQMQGVAGYIFNLGHGILPETPEAHVRYLIEMVKHCDAKN